MHNECDFVSVVSGSLCAALLGGSSGVSALRWCFFFPRHGVPTKKRGLRWFLLWLLPARLANPHVFVRTFCGLLVETRKTNCLLMFVACVCVCVCWRRISSQERCPTGPSVYQNNYRAGKDHQAAERVHKQPNAKKMLQLVFLRL